MNTGFKALIAILAAVFVLAVPSAAFAVDDNTYDPPVDPTGQVDPADPGDPADPADPGDPGDPADPADPRVSQPAETSSLPFTGGDIAALASIGVVLAGAGATAYFVSRRRNRDEPEPTRA